jgi:hypothetical protein
VILLTTGKELFLILFILTDCLAAFVQDNKGSAVNGICHHVGQKENQTGIHPLHMGQIKTRNINTFANNDGW